MAARPFGRSPEPMSGEHDSIFARVNWLRGIAMFGVVAWSVACWAGLFVLAVWALNSIYQIMWAMGHAGTHY